MNFFFETAGSIVAHSIDAPLFAVKLGEKGYYPIYTHRAAVDLNDGIPADVLDSALAGSVCGWDTPAAELAVRYAHEVEGQ